jgi:ATP-dependent Clp protease protease subunit
MVKTKTRTNSVFVIDKSSSSERAYDVYSKLLSDRIIFLKEEINDESANAVVAQLLLLDQDDQNRPISFYINSPGGSISDGLAILDTMSYISAPVNTICIGCAASMAAVLLSAGKKRASLPNSWVMIHEPRTSAIKQTITATDQEIDTKILLKMREQLLNILCKNTGQSYKKVKKDCERDLWLSSSEAKAYGIIDEIIQK